MWNDFIASIKYPPIPILNRKKIVDTHMGYPRMRHIYNKFEIWELYNVLTEDECKSLIESSEKIGFKATVSYNTSGADKVDPSIRNSKNIVVKDNYNTITAKLAEITSKVTGFPISHQEPMQVNKYDEDGLIIPHYDSCFGEMRDVCIKNNRGAGERIVTFIVYLNDEFKGGQTNFPRIGFTVQPRRGKAIVFWNTDPNENLLEESRHQGLPVIDGKKYIYTKWSHPRPLKSLTLE